MWHRQTEEVAGAGKSKSKKGWTERKQEGTNQTKPAVQRLNLLHQDGWSTKKEKTSRGISFMKKNTISSKKENEKGDDNSNVAGTPNKWIVLFNYISLNLIMQRHSFSAAWYKKWFS